MMSDRQTSIADTTKIKTHPAVKTIVGRLESAAGSILAYQHP
jgi:hypothetical protein